jgi:murein DD-endopeptidase MepM/ murein hydrolase activator NlpD
MKGVFDFRDSKAGDQWSIVHDVERGVLDFEYSTADLSTYHLERSADGGYVALREEPRLDRRTARIAGVVSTSLYDAIRDLGESPQLASDFAELFAWDVDFQRAVQPGDRFAILYERLYRTPPGGSPQYIGPGVILAARYEGQTGEHEVVYFEPREKRGGYYRSDGSSVERQFLVAPVKYSRIASTYTSSRRHPILKITRPHYGIDYAAPRGTPIFAVADGQVIYRGWSSGYGKLVKIRHNNGFISYYAHMSRYADTVQLGDYVHQKQVIGYVGATGLATGPHVCFRVKNQDGRFVNPATLRTPAGAPIPKGRMAEFELARDTLFSELDGGKVIATDEAL